MIPPTLTDTLHTKDPAMAQKKKPTRRQDDVLTPALQRFAGHKVMRLLGYWMLVQTYGGWKGVAEQPFWNGGSVQRWRLEFREVFGMDAEDYVPEAGPVLRQAFYGWDHPDAWRVGPEGRQETLHDLLGTEKA